MGETRVDLLHILEDLRDAYPGTVEETIVTEVVANSLDSGASTIRVSTDAASATLTVSDDGKGMSKEALARYHDLAATSKKRGRTIGFAGVGIKLGLLISEQVVTESRRRRTHRATAWRLSSKNRAPWRWIDPPGLQQEEGTTVRLYLRNALSTLLDPGFVESVVLAHFRPLLDPAFTGFLRPHYGEGVDIVLNGLSIPKEAQDERRVPVAIRVGRQRRPSGFGYLLRDEELDAEQSGIAISTLGKVIKRGWDWLRLSPGDAHRITGLVEVPTLVDALTLNKSDFVGRGERAASFIAYRKAIQEVVSRQLAEWGQSPQTSEGPSRRTRALERDLRSVLAGLADDFPVLTTLAGPSARAQARLPFGDGAKVVGGIAGVEEPSPAGGGSTTGETPAGATPPVEPEGADAHVPTGDAPGRDGRERPARFGLQVRFESRPDAIELARLLESTIWVNDAHPAYRRAVASRSEGYHIALSAAMALAPLAVEAEQAHGFVTAFMAEWGQAGRPRR